MLKKLLIFIAISSPYFTSISDIESVFFVCRFSSVFFKIRVFEGVVFSNLKLPFYIFMNVQIAKSIPSNEVPDITPKTRYFYSYSLSFKDSLKSAFLPSL